MHVGYFTPDTKKIDFVANTSVLFTRVNFRMEEFHFNGAFLLCGFAPLSSVRDFRQYAQ